MRSSGRIPIYQIPLWDRDDYLYLQFLQSDHSGSGIRSPSLGGNRTQSGMSLSSFVEGDVILIERGGIDD